MTSSAARAQPVRERDRLRELLDAVLDEGNQNLGEMATAAHSSPFHFARELSRGAGEPPVAMRRRVMLERAAWQLGHGASVTEASQQAGYESVEGFRRAYARAYGHPPGLPPERGSGESRRAARRITAHWLPAPNGVHFHPPTSLWVAAEQERTMNVLNDLLLQHDLEDTRYLLGLAAEVPEEELQRPLLPGASLQAWTWADDSPIAVLHHLVWAKAVWLAAVEGLEMPTEIERSLPALSQRLDALAEPWLAMLRDIERRGAWDDRVIDALCEPPESFVLSGIVAHVLTYAVTRRQLARLMLRELLGADAVDEGDPINWMRDRDGRTD